MADSLNTERFLTARQVALKIGVSSATVTSMLHRRKLPFFRYGRDFKIPISAVVEFMKKNYYEKK